MCCVGESSSGLRRRRRWAVMMKMCIHGEKFGSGIGKWWKLGKSISG